VVEHSLGKGEVLSSILSGSTIKTRFQALARDMVMWPDGIIHAGANERQQESGFSGEKKATTPTWGLAGAAPAWWPEATMRVSIIDPASPLVDDQLSETLNCRCTRVTKVKMP
jgi:hypothetical protein